MRRCVEEGILQAYVDNELSSEMVEEVAAHIAGCASCAQAASEASAQTVLFASAFEAENSLAVPTFELRERIEASIAEIEAQSGALSRRHNSAFSRWLAGFAGLLKGSPQRVPGFAALIVVVALAAVFAVVRWNKVGSDGQPTEIADGGEGTDKSPRAIANPTPTPASPDNGNGGTNEETPQKSRPQPKKQPKQNLVPAPDELPKDELATLTPLPGEENYLKAIDSLTVEIKTSGEAAMKPSLRAEYERSLAIVDQAIDSTRRAARRNPNDPDASAFLYSSYKSKLDLLTTVAEQVRPTIATR